MEPEKKQTWANFLHIYQPPTQFPQVLRKIAAESYSELVAVLKSNSSSRVTLNINGSLTEQLDREGLGGLIDEIRGLAEKGQIEFTGSAKYHPILPKLPKDEIRRQVRLNDETNKRYFGKAWSPKGFFPPEMSYSRDVAEVVAQFGFKWVILSEYAFPEGLGSSGSAIYHIKGLPLKVFFRDHELSLRVAFGEVQTTDKFFSLINQFVQDGDFLLTAMDGETFGHHRPGLQKLLASLYSDPRINSVLISDLVDKFQSGPHLEPLPSSWGLESEEFKRGIIYPRWEFPGNSIQSRQWELTNIALKAVWATPNFDKSYDPIREKLDQALHSDQYWWAGARPNWHFRLVEIGSRWLKDVVNQAVGSSDDDKALASQLYHEIVDLGLKMHGDRVIEVK
jgi:Glycosyl hydrolase family 57